MSSFPTDRSLLFGILALQNNFISRESLLAALGDWSADKNQPLDELLQSRSGLNARQCHLLSALADEHLSQAEHSLQTVEAGLQELQEIDTTARLPAKAEAAADPWQTLSLPDARAPKAELRFRRLRPHARGGLGEVFVARDTELNRDVALKEIRPQHADDLDSRARFVLEAEVTGGLEHPGIVPVYGLGTYPDGRPYYAMRFIRGENLRCALRKFHAAAGTMSPAARSLELRKLLGHFVTVCQTIEYAHSRGVLHRDLKPGNVMLGEYGETLVVDWGLAKPQASTTPEVRADQFKPHSQSGSTATQLGTAIGTPSYMSPEQAAGRWDQIGPASDVYCLGATLYEVLTGRPPLTGDDVGRVLQLVEKGEFPRPREINGSIHRSLEAICLKAMAREAAQRYPTAQALAHDVQRWLADEETEALPDTRLGRVGRWLNHHRNIARAAIAAVVMVAFVASLSAALIHQQKRQVERLTGEIFLLSHHLHDAESHHDHARLQSEAQQKVQELNYWSSSQHLESSCAKAIAPRRTIRERVRGLWEGKPAAGEGNMPATTDPK